jgi:hypothetical protein
VLTTPVPRRTTLRITATCNNRCIFCAQDGLDAEPVVLDDELRALKRSASELTFVGGEPTVWPGLLDAVRAARSAGFEAIGIQTNGAGLAQAGFARALREAGLTDVHVSLHGAEASVHDYHTGRPGSFTILLAALGAARDAGLDLVATTVVTRSSFRSLSALPALLKRNGISAWSVLLAHAAGRTEAAFDRIMPRLGLAMPFVLHAVSDARERGLPAWVQGAPLCLLGSLSHFSLPEATRAYGEACAGCEARPLCPGVDAAYLRRFGGDELRSRAAPSEPTTEHALTRMFVGVGPIALRRAAVVESPRTVSLPILGKVQPALREVARGAPRRSGDALREILPGLFDGGEKDKLE